MRFVRSIFAWITITLSTALLGTLSLFVAWIPPRGHLMWPFARLWGRWYLAAAGVRIEIDGPPLPPNAPFVYVANHASLLDIPALLGFLPTGARFLAKKVLFYIPWVGWNMWLAGFIPIDRSNRKKAVKALEAASQRMKVGCPVLVFPEETRSPRGVLLPFQKGAFLLAMKAHIPVVPVGIEGAHLLLPKGGFWITPGTIRIRWGEPIVTAGMHHHDRDALIRRARAEILRLRGGGEATEKDVASQSGKAELLELEQPVAAASAESSG